MNQLLILTSTWGTNSDILQTICAVIAVPATLITIYKLMSRDKEREKEIEKITDIADKLTLLVTQQKQQDKNIRRPTIIVKVEVLGNNRIKFHFTNSNKNCAIISIDVEYDINNEECINSTINTDDGNQLFYTDCTLKNRLTLHNFLMIYNTEEGYQYKQQITLFNDNKISTSIVYDSEKLKKVIE
ncbi:hypothetical protein EYY60_07680 [Flavobacterium zhairuonense]|uniref:hypothetical protein n=1 Tax=Flavobacterium zhairuonense TaxID=2493631 RepID=UPI001049900A|nr:hypothetical protein [Flavobacterium zhairuonense]KAF2512120.1 hypothetical protein EYY60_07680 [Flavobacterium zhairuonense]